MTAVRLFFYAVVLPGIVLLYLPIRIGIGSGWTVEIGPARYLGPMLMGAGLLLYFWCVFDFADERHVSVSPAAASRFIVQGPYQFVRNPMYIGGLAILAGHGLWFQAPAMVPYILMVFVAFHLLIVLFEEPAFERRFGDEYRVYRNSVRRWIPGRPRIDEEL
jgi:protein-S-isoprenylcysteine O-methyltransferase Ste14